MLGFVTTFVGVFVSATGTLLAPFVAASTPDRRVHVATMGALMMIAHLAKIAAFGFIGFAIGRYVPLMVAMIATGAVGNWIGEVALLRTKEQHFRLVLQVGVNDPRPAPVCGARRAAPAGFDANCASRSATQTLAVKR